MKEQEPLPPISSKIRRQLGQGMIELWHKDKQEIAASIVCGCNPCLGRANKLTSWWDSSPISYKEAKIIYDKSKTKGK